MRMADQFGAPELPNGVTVTACELLTTEQMAIADQFAVSVGVASSTLMETAGRAVADCAAAMVSPTAPIVVLCGPGNNGGDGFVAARLLRDRGFDVRVGCLVDQTALRGDAAVMAKLWAGPIGSASHLELAGAALIIDALFGAGLSRPLDATASAIVASIAKLMPSVPVLSIDVPSGLDGNTGDAPLQADGAARGAVACATRTVTFFRRKPGHLLMPGRVLCGELEVADIGIPVQSLAVIAPKTFRNDPELWRQCWRAPVLDIHKYDRGHAVVVSGPAARTGAARLAARGALRIGAGLVTVASPNDAVAINAAQLTAIMVAPFDPPEGLREIFADPRINAILIGPGNGVTLATRSMVDIAFASSADVIIDADAITVFKCDPDMLFALTRRRAAENRPVVMTPHEGEFKRLFPDCSGSKLERARAAASHSGAVILLKGVDTVIAAPDGRAAINDNAPASLATAGSGDVLAGFITGLIAQGWPAWHAACASAWLHGACAAAFGPSLIAEDLPEQLSAVQKKFLVR